MRVHTQTPAQQLQEIIAALTLLGIDSRLNEYSIGSGPKRYLFGPRIVGRDVSLGNLLQLSHTNQDVVLTEFGGESVTVTDWELSQLITHILQRTGGMDDTGREN